MITYTEWAFYLALRAGKSVINYTNDNMHFLIAWAMKESGGENVPVAHKAHFNAFNTTQRWPGSTDFNDVPVQNYQTFDNGLDATLATLHNGLYNPLLASLHLGTWANLSAYCLAHSEWGTGSVAAELLTVNAYPNIGSTLYVGS
jgi:hypothetical protein